MTDPRYLRLVEKTPWERAESYDHETRPSAKLAEALDLYEKLSDDWHDRRERRIDYAYIVAGALCAVAGLGLAWWVGVLS